MMRALGANAVLVDQVEGKPGNVSALHNPMKSTQIKYKTVSIR